MPFKFRGTERDGTMVFLTGNFAPPAMTVAGICRSGRQVVLFRWTRQRLRMKAFFGTTENAVKTRIRIAASVRLAVAIVRKGLNAAEATRPCRFQAS